jgi:hypothetical protein
VPIGKGGWGVQAGSNSPNLGRLGQMVQGLNRAKQNIEIFNYQQDRKDEGMLKRYAAESAVKTMDRNKEFELADKHIKTHGSDFVDDPRTGKKRRVTRRNVTAGRYSTGEPDNTPSYGDQLIKNTELKREMAATKLEAARLRAEERKNSGGKPKKTAAKKTSAGKPRVKKVTATKETTADVAVDSMGTATRIGKDGKMPPKKKNVKKMTTGGGLTEVRNSNVETGNRGKK